MRYQLLSCVIVVCGLIVSSECRAEGLRIFWSDNRGIIYRVDADGSNQISFNGPEPFTFGLGVHGPRRELYAASYTSNVGFNIYRMSLDGTNPTPVLTGTGNYLAVDAVNDKLYWETARYIMRANLDGTESETIMASEPDFFGFATITELAVDGAHDALYWLENGRPFRSTLNGQNREPLFGMDDIENPSRASPRRPPTAASAPVFPSTTSVRSSPAASTVGDMTASFYFKSPPLSLPIPQCSPGT